MNLDELKNRLAFLKDQRDKNIRQVEQVSANISAFNGAIEECEYWITKASETEV